MTSACSYSLPFIYVAFLACLHCCTTSVSPLRLQPSRQRERQTELQAEEVSTTNSLKHTTDIKEDKRKKNMEEKRREEECKGEWEKVPESTDDRPNLREDYLNNIWNQVGIIFSGRASMSVTSYCSWLTRYTTATQIHKIILFLVPQMQMKLMVMVVSDLLPLYF